MTSVTKRGRRPRGASPAAFVAAAIFAVLMLGLLAALLITVRSQLSHARSQDHAGRALLSAASPGLTALPPALAALTPTLQTLPRTQPERTARLARGLAQQASPVLAALASTNLAGVLNELGILARSVNVGNRLPTLLSELDVLARSANDGHRLLRLLDASSRFLFEIQREHLIASVARAARGLPQVSADVPVLVALQRRALSMQQQSLEVQRQSLSAQNQSLDLLRQSLAIQQQTLQHAESLDRKVP